MFAASKNSSASWKKMATSSCTTEMAKPLIGLGFCALVASTATAVPDGCCVGGGTGASNNMGSINLVLPDTNGSQTLPVYMYSSGNIASPSVWLLVDSGDPEHALVGWTIEVIDGGTQKLSFFKNMPGGTQQCSHATATPPEKFVYGFSMCTGTKPDAMFAVYSESFSVGSVAGDTWENVPHTSYVSVASGCSLLSVGGANTPFGLGAFIATFTNSTSTFPTGVKLPSYCSS